MPISLAEIHDLGARYHHLVGIEKGDAAAQGAFFIHPNPIISVEHASDLTLRDNYEIHQGMTDEQFIPLEPWTVTQLCDEPERARGIGGVLWQGQAIGDEEHGRIKVVVGEDWIVQRVPNGEVRFALYINTHHQLLPDSRRSSLADQHLRSNDTGASDEAASAEVAERYERIAAGFRARLDGLRDEQWSWPTPCTEWTTADLVEHVIGVHGLILAMLGDREVGSEVIGSDLVAAWSDATGMMQRALRDRSRAAKVVVTPFGEMPFEDLASRVVCSDTLVHTWDLARATGQGEHLDARAVEFAWTWMEPAGERLRASGDFGPAVMPPPDADTQTCLLCFLGRDAGPPIHD